MSAILPFSFTLYGQPIQGLSVPIGSSVTWSLASEDPVTREAFDLTNCTLQMSLCALGINGAPIEPPAATWSGTIEGSAPAGDSTVEWAPTDTSMLTPGSYALDYWITDTDGDRLQIMGTSIISLTSAATLP